MIARAAALILIAVLSLATSWLWGYHEGQQTGAFSLLQQIKEKQEPDDAQNNLDMDRDKVCNEIRNYKPSIAQDLDENTEICGWSDMDRNSN